uniref:Uncharacterized protein n=1 Tax=Schistocephalus solidus TaxID=70667 RepID=A0A0X3PAA2_SCHSO
MNACINHKIIFAPKKLEFIVFNHMFGKLSVWKTTCRPLIEIATYTHLSCVKTLRTISYSLLLLLFPKTGLTNQESGKYRQTIAYFQREESFHQHTVNNLQHRLDLNEVEINQLRQAFQALQAGESFSVEDSIYGGMHNSSLPVMGLDLSFANDSCQRLPPLNETFSLSQTHLSPFDVKQANNIYLRDEASRIQHTNFQSDCKELNGVQNRAYEGELDTGAELRELHRRLEHCGNWVQKCDPDEQESAF